MSDNIRIFVGINKFNDEPYIPYILIDEVRFDLKERDTALEAVEEVQILVAYLNHSILRGEQAYDVSPTNMVKEYEQIKERRNKMKD